MFFCMILFMLIYIIRQKIPWQRTGSTNEMFFEMNYVAVHKIPYVFMQTGVRNGIILQLNIYLKYTLNNHMTKFASHDFYYLLPKKFPWETNVLPFIWLHTFSTCKFIFSQTKKATLKRNIKTWNFHFKKPPTVCFNISFFLFRKLPKNVPLINTIVIVS